MERSAPGLLHLGEGAALALAAGVVGGAAMPFRGFAVAGGAMRRLAAARALLAHSTLSAPEIVRTALQIAAGIDVYTNEEIVIEEMASET